MEDSRAAQLWSLLHNGAVPDNRWTPESQRYYTHVARRFDDNNPKQPTFITTYSGKSYTIPDLIALLDEARNYIPPTTSSHEEISDIIGLCNCGYCGHVPQHPT